MTSIYQGCAALFSTDVAQLDFVNLQGLFIISMIAVLIGVTVGLWEDAPPSLVGKSGHTLLLQGRHGFDPRQLRRTKRAFFPVGNLK
jgi:hypothetical protein